MYIYVYIRIHIFDSYVLVYELVEQYIFDSHVHGMANNQLVISHSLAVEYLLSVTLC
jgi:hypothetical protein